MKRPDEPLFDLLCGMLAELCNGTLTPDRAARLEQLLSQRRDARQFYLEYMDLHAALQWEVGGRMEVEALVRQFRQELDRQCRPEPDRQSFEGGCRACANLPPEFPAHASARVPMARRVLRTPATLRGWVTAACVAAAIVPLAVLLRNTLQQSIARKPDATVASTENAAAPYAAAPPVAHLTTLADCRWIVATTVPQQGDPLFVGQSLHLAAGVACLEFDVGANVFLQGPADLTIVAAKQLRLDRGKLMASITSDKAHGLTVLTPQGTLVDLGTEFGIEITPDGSSKVHVFRGKVEFALPTDDGSPPQTAQCLMAGGAARVDAGSDQMTLVADTGEYFIRSLDRLVKDRHVVAYWRFEDRPLGAIAPHTNKNLTPIRATIDSSFNGNDLYAYTDDSRPKFSGKVPLAEVPQTHAPNHACLDNSDCSPHRPSGRNVYTRSAFSHASPIDIQKITPREWTIEVSAKAAVMGIDRQTIVGRDTHNPPSNKFPAPARLSLEITKQHRFAINFYDVSNHPHEAVAEQLPVRVNQWYHLAAVSDGRTLKLYIDNGNGHGYQLCGAADLPATGDKSLGKGSDAADWTIGRGLIEGRAAASFQGCIDEVRVSDIARKPEEFLFAPGEPPSEPTGTPPGEPPASATSGIERGGKPN